MLSINVMRSPSARSAAGEPSVEPLSTTRMRKFGWVCRASEAMQRSVSARPFQFKTTITTSGGTRFFPDLTVFSSYGLTAPAASRICAPAPAVRAGGNVFWFFFRKKVTAQVVSPGEALDRGLAV